MRYNHYRRLAPHPLGLPITATQGLKGVNGVEFVSSTEKFDTSTPMGRAMLNICIVFAQLERETIQKRVTDAYHSRVRRGYFMGGSAPYGFTTQHTVIDGVNTKMLVADPATSQNVKLMYEMYANPSTSLGSNHKEQR